MFKIICDSSCDIREYKDIAFEAVPIFIYNNHHSYYDDEYLDISNMLKEVEDYEGRTFTSCPSVERWMDTFSEKRENYVVTLTGGISSTFESAWIARNLFLEDHPRAKIGIIDSLSTGPEMKLIVDKIVSMKNQGICFDDIMNYIPGYAESVRMLLVLQSTRNLLDNGRIHKLSRNAKGVLKYTVVAKFTLQGRIEVLERFRGNRKTISGTVQKMQKMGFSGRKVRITYVGDKKLAMRLGYAISSYYPSSEIEYAPAGGLCSFYVEYGGMMVAFET